jgi:copper chaperone CopZ
MAIAEFKVSGVSCQHCVAKVRKALESFEQVNNVSISSDNQILKLDAEPMPPIESLNEKLEDYGNYRLSI